MAIKQVEQEALLENPDAIYFEVNNGDLEALQETQQNWRFKSKENLLRFATTVLYKAKSRRIYFEDEDGHKVLVEPASILLDDHQKENDKSD